MLLIEYHGRILPLATRGFPRVKLSRVDSRVDYSLNRKYPSYTFLLAKITELVLTRFSVLLVTQETLHVELLRRQRKENSNSNLPAKYYFVDARYFEVNFADNRARGGVSSCKT